MRIEYTCEDGSKTLATWPSMALLHWLGRSYPIPPIDNPEPFKLYVVSSPVPSDDHEMFLTLDDWIVSHSPVKRGGACRDAAGTRRGRSAAAAARTTPARAAAADASR